MSKKKTVNIDLDGVIYPFNAVFGRWLNLEGRPAADGKPYPTPTTWNYWDEWGITEGEWRNQFRRGVEAGHIWTEGWPMFGAVNGMWQLSDAGIYVRIVTHRLNHKFGHQKAITATVNWLERFNIPYRSIAFLGSEGKDNYAAEAIVDDNMHNVKSFWGKGIIYDQPWNQELEETDMITRAKNWLDVVRIIKEEVE